MTALFHYIRAELQTVPGRREMRDATGAAIGCCVWVAAAALIIVGVWGKP